MKEIWWNGGYYREGGTALCNGEIKLIDKLEVEIVENGSKFDRQEILNITTRDGKVFHSISR